MSKKPIDICSAYRNGRGCTLPGFVTVEGKRYCRVCDPTPEGEARRYQKEMAGLQAYGRASALCAMAGATTPDNGEFKPEAGEQS